LLGEVRLDDFFLDPTPRDAACGCTYVSACGKIGTSTQSRSSAVDEPGFKGRLDFLLGMDSVR
jgi:hypothetical protein